MVLSSVAGPFYDLPFGKCAWYVDEALVGGAAEKEVGVALGFDEGTIDENIDELEQFTLGWLGEECLKSVAGVAPDILLGTLTNGSS